MFLHLVKFSLIIFSVDRKLQFCKAKYLSHISSITGVLISLFLYTNVVNSPTEEFLFFSSINFLTLL